MGTCVLHQHCCGYQHNTMTVLLVPLPSSYVSPPICVTQEETPPPAPHTSASSAPPAYRLLYPQGGGDEHLQETHITAQSAGHPA